MTCAEMPKRGLAFDDVCDALGLQPTAVLRLLRRQLVAVCWRDAPMSVQVAAPGGWRK